MGQTVDSGRPEALSVAEALEVERRRDLIRYLHDHAPAIAVADVAAELAHYRHSGPGEPSPLRIAILDAHLRHVDLPMLSRAGLVTYDHPQEAIELTDHAKTIAPVTDLMSETQSGR